MTSHLPLKPLPSVAGIKGNTKYVEICLDEIVLRMSIMSTKLSMKLHPVTIKISLDDTTSMNLGIMFRRLMLLYL